jgi:hypothetical protein
MTGPGGDRGSVQAHSHRREYSAKIQCTGVAAAVTDCTIMQRYRPDGAIDQYSRGGSLRGRRARRDPVAAQARLASRGRVPSPIALASEERFFAYSGATIG